MQKINKAARKFRITDEGTINVYENDTVARYDTGIDTDSIVVSKEPLESSEIFFIEIEKTNVSSYSAEVFGKMQFDLIDRFNEDDEFVITYLNDNCSIFKQQPCILKQSPRDVYNGLKKVLKYNMIRTPYLNSLLPTVYQHFLGFENWEQLTTLLGHRIGIFYLYFTDTQYIFMYLMSRNGVSLISYPHPTSRPKYLLISLGRIIKQIRSLPLYTVPSLQGLCQEVIFKCIRANGALTKRSLENLPLPSVILEQLLIHAE
ncbi:uncharacterized protein LOC105185313 [Harpegnathos saltator]|uniref:uncharacterized protein LOC105185313 n=1 Tax=Harpegnathos saltator TaxID=610380 RepID=UPI000DBEE50A|nr:uncharacterized protein LOC105185313 [Harpegnathos saltator]XP_025155875.1 uncharacterized protein LOC105185313 [Harpegnathos saltator]XP_025155876.1 uncharacterized protein LOC105185313 [Harpegnathos saltator]